MPQSVERFSSRIDNYIKYRPGYPPQILDLLKAECELTEASVIADIGSGTGKLTEPFLSNGNTIFGVEPNEGMRTAAETILQSFSNFRSVAGTAESTTLSDSSVDFVIAGQAFHWFDPVGFKTESIRILKPNGWVALIWNARQLVSTPFLEDYERLLITYGIDYQDVRHEKAENTISDFFAPNPFRLEIFPNVQVFDFEGLRGRVGSSSYTPERGHPKYEPMMNELKAVFDKHQQHNRVVFGYDTKVFYGHLTQH